MIAKTEEKNRKKERSRKSSDLAEASPEGLRAEAAPLLPQAPCQTGPSAAATEEGNNVTASSGCFKSIQHMKIHGANHNSAYTLSFCVTNTTTSPQKNNNNRYILNI